MFLETAPLAPAPGSTFAPTDAWQPLGTFHAGVTGAIDPTRHARLTVIAELDTDGTPTHGFFGELAPDDTGAAALDLAFPTDRGDRTVASLQAYDPTGYLGSKVWIEHAGTSATFDVADLLAYPSAPTPTPTGARWAPTDPRADAILVALYSTDTVWLAIVPPTATSVVLPTLPDDLAARWNDTMASYLEIADRDGADYSSLRADADLLFNEGLRPPGFGRVRIADATAPPS
jgi:hypothetical protein